MARCRTQFGATGTELCKRRLRTAASTLARLLCHLSDSPLRGSRIGRAAADPIRQPRRGDRVFRSWRTQAHRVHNALAALWSERCWTNPLNRSRMRSERCLIGISATWLLKHC